MALVDEDWSVVQRTLRVESPWEGMMVSLPLTEPIMGFEAYDEPQPLREAVRDCLASLPERERCILEYRYTDRVTIRHLAALIGLHKSHAHRLLRKSEAHLAAVLIEHPVVQEAYGI